MVYILRKIVLYWYTLRCENNFFILAVGEGEQICFCPVITFQESVDSDDILACILPSLPLSFPSPSPAPFSVSENRLLPFNPHWHLP